MFEPRRIAIIKPSALGDIVHALPVLTALREKFPNSRISWVVNRGFEPLLIGHPHLDATIAFDRAAFRRVSSALKYSFEVMNTLRRQRFDLVIDLQGLLRSGLLCAATGSPVRIGFANAREGADRFYTHRIEVLDADSLHAVDRYWRIVESLGYRGKMKFVLPVSEEESEKVHQELKLLPRPWIAVAAGAKWTTKQWLPEHFKSLLKQAQDAFGGTVILIGSADDRMRSAEIYSQLAGSKKDWTGETTLPRLVALLSIVDVMVANDTGPLHLAVALGRPCIAPYTCTKTARHGPYPFNPKSIGIESTVACAGSYYKSCPNGMICMSELTPGKLWPSLARALDS